MYFFIVKDVTVFLCEALQSNLGITWNKKVNLKFLKINYLGFLF